MNGWQKTQLVCMALLWIGAPVFNFLNKKYNDPNNPKHKVIVSWSLVIWFLAGPFAGLATYKEWTKEPPKAKLALYFYRLPLTSGTNLFTVPLVNQIGTFAIEVRNLNTNVPAEDLQLDLQGPPDWEILDARGWLLGSISKYDLTNILPPVQDRYLLQRNLGPLFHHNYWEAFLSVKGTNFETSFQGFRLSVRAKNADPATAYVLAHFHPQCTTPTNIFLYHH